MTRELVLPSPLGPAQAASWFRSWAEVASEPDLRLVLPAGSFLRPSGVAWLASAVAERQESGLRTSLRSEVGAEDAYRYLQRIDFFSALGVTAEQAFVRREPAGRFVPLRRIADERTAHDLAEKSLECLRTQIPELPSSPLRMARFVFEELGVNIVQHSARASTGFGLLQTYANGIEIAFADRGVGFLSSLQRNPELEGRIQDDAEALQIAIGKGATGSGAPRRNMGMGLGLLQDFADRIGGELWIASGGAMLRRRSVAGLRTTTVHGVAPWPGSWIALEASLWEA